MTRWTSLDVMARIISWGVVATMLGWTAIVYLALATAHDPFMTLQRWPAAEPRTERELLITVIARRDVERGQIASGPGVGALADQYDRLRRASALPGEARGAVDRLLVVVVRLTTEPLPATCEDGPLQGFHDLSLDVDNIGASALLVVADRPLRLRMRDDVGVRGRFAFEGDTVFDVCPLRQGFISGFRSGVYGAKGTLSASDFVSANAANRRRLCAGLSRWSDHFKQPPDMVDILVVEDPSRLVIYPGYVGHDGVAVSGPVNIHRLCS
ncbi:MAG: hypothetical protein NW217_16430 [Hyphomicrobiaceae bacterium]|nr:hypothetical protein [Hyphomicrobiaceae bacterium]